MKMSKYENGKIGENLKKDENKIQLKQHNSIKKKS